MNLQELFGDIDIYLFDQILKNRFAPNSKILDAGCGGGRNIVWFLRNGFEVFGIDQNADAVGYCCDLARSITLDSPTGNFQIAPVEKIPFIENSFDLVISSAVLHFAENEKQFDEMLKEMWRVLKPNGILFVRLASDIGIEAKVRLIEGRRFALPDGSDRFLVNEEMLINKAKELNAVFLEPIKTTNVQNLRCMTTVVLSKN